MLEWHKKCIDTWNGLKEEVIMARNVWKINEQLNKYRYEDPVYYKHTCTHYSHKKKYVLKLERIHRITTKMVPDLEDLTYEERLKEMQVTTLK